MFFHQGFNNLCPHTAYLPVLFALHMWKTASSLLIPQVAFHCHRLLVQSKSLLRSCSRAPPRGESVGPSDVSVASTTQKSKLWEMNTKEMDPHWKQKINTAAGSWICFTCLSESKLKLSISEGELQGIVSQECWSLPWMGMFYLSQAWDTHVFSCPVPR